MGLDITILVGTMTGTAEMVAQEVQQALEAAGHQATIRMMEASTPASFRAAGTFLICTSTYGQGDVPDNAQALFNSLEAEKAEPRRRDLRGDRAGRSHLQRYVLSGRHYALTSCSPNSAPGAPAKS